MWCCNRSLADIAFEECRFEGICMPMRLSATQEEPLSLRLTDCTVVGRKGSESIGLIEGTYVKRVVLERVSIQNLTDAKICCEPAAEVIVTNETSLTAE